MKCYYAVFKETNQAIEVEFPDLEGCVTFGSDWDEAIKNAIDVLAGWLANAEPQFIRPPSSHKDLEKYNGILIPIPVDNEILEKYQELKRINIILPSAILKRIDSFRKKRGLKRSTFLQKASEEYLQRYNEPKFSSDFMENRDQPK